MVEYVYLRNELESVTGLMQRHISANARTTLDQDEYPRRYETYAASMKKPIDGLMR